MEKDRREVPVIELQLQRLPLQELFEEETEREREKEGRKNRMSERERQRKKKLANWIRTNREKRKKEKKKGRRRTLVSGSRIVLSSSGKESRMSIG